MKQNKTILLAEDNPINLKMALKLLTLLGYQVKTVVNGELALQTYQQAPDVFALVLMDCEMPKLNGIAATEAIRCWEQTQGCSAVPIIMWSAQIDEHNLQLWQAAGVNDYLAKPFELAELQGKLSQWIDGVVPPKVESVARAVLTRDCLLDQQVLQQLQELDAKKTGFIRGLVRQYEQQGQELIVMMRQQLACTNVDALRKSAHTLKSSSASFGATQLAQYCRQIESEPDCVAQVTVLLEQISALFVEVIGVLKRRYMNSE